MKISAWRERTISKDLYRTSRQLMPEVSFVSECPLKWFRFDSWKTEYALLLLAGVEPEEANVTWRDPVAHHSGCVRHRVKIIDAHLIGFKYYLESEFPSMDVYGRKSWREKAIEAYDKLDDHQKKNVKLFMDDHDFYDHLGRDLNISEIEYEFLEINKGKRAFDWAEACVNSLYDFWVSRKDAELEFNPERRYPRKYFIDWVKESNLQDFLPWWDDAIERGLISDSYRETDHPKPVAPTLKVSGYLDVNHDHFSLKLKAAVDAWEAVSSLPTLTGTPKMAIKKWLCDNARNYGLYHDDGSLNSTGIEEIAKIANWKPKGGVPKTQE